MANQIYIEKSYIAASILNFKSKYLREEFITLEELSYVSNQFQKKLNEQNSSAIILDRINNDYFDISDVIKINRSNGLTLKSIITRYQGYLDLDILLLIWNEETICDYLRELQKVESMSSDVSCCKMTRKFKSLDDNLEKLNDENCQKIKYFTPEKCAIIYKRFEEELDNCFGFLPCLGESLDYGCGNVCLEESYGTFLFYTVDRAAKFDVKKFNDVRIAIKELALFYYEICYIDNPLQMEQIICQTLGLNCKEELTTENSDVMTLKRKNTI